MKKINEMFMLIVCVVCIYLITSITMKQVNPIVIDKVEPTTIVAGQDFNLFEGKSTMALYGKGFQTGDVIYLNGQPQDTAVGNDGWMTCFVDKNVYQEAGKLKIEIKRTNEKGKVVKKSDVITIPIQ